MILPLVFAGLGAWCLANDAVAAGVGSIVWGALYGAWWWRSRTSGAPPPEGSLLGRAALPVAAVAGFAALVVGALELTPAASPFAPLLDTSPSASSAPLFAALPPVALLVAVLLLLRERRRT